MKNRQYKDSVFTLLFNDPSLLRELYNAIEGSSYGEDTAIVINTLKNILFKGQKNDISFTIDNKFVVFLEHQSTVNLNMPLRFLLFAGRVYEKIVNRRALYKQAQIPIPTPEFIVLYNGKASQPDETALRISDAFIAGGVPAGLELVVRVLNVNAGHNRRILGKSKTLGEYAEFIAKAREYEKEKEKEKKQENRGKGKSRKKNREEEDKDREECLQRAVKYCIDHDILKDFLTEHASEVINMLMTEWNWDDARDVWKEEAREEGIAEGREEGKAEGREEVLELLKTKGYDTSELEAEMKKAGSKG
jgi:hypothetical protein